MAGFNFAPINVPQQPQTSLADMLNIARGAQAYGQAQQLNPLALEKAQADLSLSQTQAQKAQATLPYEISSSQSQAGKAAAELNDAQLANLIKQQSNSSRNLIKLLDLDEPITPEIIKNHVIKTMSNANATDNAIEQAVQNLPKSGTDKQLRAYVAKHALNSLTAEAEIEKRFPAATMVQQGGMLVPRQMGNEQLTGVRPGTQVGPEIKISQTPGTATVNGLVGQYDSSGTFVPFNIQPSQTATPPTNAPATVAPTAKQQAMPKLLQIDEPRSPGQFNEQESARFKLGAEDFNKIQQRSTLAQESALDAAIIKKSLAAASGGKPGQIMRDTGQFLFGDAQKDELVKTLARNAVNQSALMGVKNEAAGQDVKVANGSEQITAEALAHIVERIESTNLAAEKYNKALIKLQEKHGKDKAYLNNDNFKAAWGSAYNPIAFIIQNTNRQNIPQKDKDKIIDYYTRDMSQDQLDDLHDSQVKLKRLERGDF